MPLNFTVDKATSGVGYSLDNQAKGTVNDDAILKDSPTDSHNVTVYAEDTPGNKAASETLYFTIEEPELSPVALVLASTAAVSVVS